MHLYKIMRHFIAIILTLSFSISGLAGSLVVPAGLEFDFSEEFNFPENLDITYQVIPSIDKSVKYMAIWNGDELQYTILVEKLPLGYSDCKLVLEGMARDYRTVFKQVKTGGNTTFSTIDKLKATAIELLYGPNSDGLKSTIIVHLTDGKEAYTASVTQIPKGANTDAILKEVVSIFRAAKVADPSTVPQADKREEDDYVGNWESKSTRPDGEMMLAKMSLDKYLNFRMEVSVKGKTTFLGTGSWFVSDKTIFWNHMYSNPPLTEKTRKDQLDIISFDNGVLILRSQMSGWTSTFKKIP